MSILDNSGVTSQQHSEVTAQRLKQLTVITFQQMVNAFNGGVELFWNNSSATPAEIAQALGNDAGEIFELHAKLGQLIGSVKPEAIQQSLSKIGSVTKNNDGTITVN